MAHWRTERGFLSEVEPVTMPKLFTEEHMSHDVVITTRLGASAEADVSVEPVVPFEHMWAIRVASGGVSFSFAKGETP